MRLTSLLALLFLAAALAVPVMVPEQRSAMTLLAAAGLLFLAWWLAHLAALARITYRQRGGAMAAERRRHPTPAGVAAGALLNAAIWTSPLWWPLRLLGLAQAWPQCNCYFDTDCWVVFFRFCDWSVQCVTVAKDTNDCPRREEKGLCDGVCGWISPISGKHAEPAALAGRVRSVFDLYIRTARSGDALGYPTLAEIEPLWEGMPAPLCQDFRAWAFTALRTVLGWDAALGRPEPHAGRIVATEMFYAHVAHPEATPLILEAARDGLADALEKRDPERAAEPLARFWKTFPDYHAAHMGHCYPHGHGEFPDAFTCQAEHLQALAEAMLRAAGHLPLGAAQSQ